MTYLGSKQLGPHKYMKESALVLSLISKWRNWARVFHIEDIFLPKSMMTRPFNMIITIWLQGEVFPGIWTQSMLATRMILVGYLVLTDFPNVRDKGKHFGGCSLCHNIPNFWTNHECNLFHNMPTFGTNHAIDHILTYLTHRTLQLPQVAHYLVVWKSWLGVLV